MINMLKSDKVSERDSNKMRKLLFLIFTSRLLAGLYACDRNKDEVKLANPASVFCAENGGKTSIRIENYGDVGFCLFPDGTECEEWAYFRGECMPGKYKTTDYE